VAPPGITADGWQALIGRCHGSMVSRAGSCTQKIFIAYRKPVPVQFEG
jgi:hypothetical protein